MQSLHVRKPVDLHLLVHEVGPPGTWAPHGTDIDIYVDGRHILLA